MRVIGIPKEIKSLERRVGLVPSAVAKLKSLGLKILVERNAGEGSGFSNDDYQKAGAEIITSPPLLYRNAQLIQKVKEPLPQEFELLQKHQILFCYLHLASPENCKLVKTLCEKGVSAIGFETLEVGGRFPLLAPMSEIAGSLAAAYGAALREEGLLKVPAFDAAQVLQVLEKTASQYPDFNLACPGVRYVIWGGGVAGLKAMEIALKLRAEVAMIEKNSERREFLKRFIPQVYSPDKLPQQVLEEADILIGCVHARGARAARVLDDGQLKQISLRKTKILIDVSIDQGGNFPGSKATTYQNAAYHDQYHNLRFAVANMPSLCGRGASESLCQETLPYTQVLAVDALGAFLKYPELKNAINIENGEIKIEEIRAAHGL